MEDLTELLARSQKKKPSAKHKTPGVRLLKMYVFFSPLEMLQIGLDLFGLVHEFGPEESHSMMRDQVFNSLFGANPVVCATLWKDLQITQTDQAAIKIPQDGTIPGMYCAQRFFACASISY